MKYAFLCGINEYKNTDWNLRGCVDDALDAYQVLSELFEFPRDNIRLLTDSRATQENILARLNWLVRSLKDGDTGAFYYSGHGSQVRDRNGDELKDGMDEVIVCSDHDWSDPLTDDKIYGIISTLQPGAKLYVIYDCCYSGTGTRMLVNPLASALIGHGMEFGKARYIQPPIDILMRSYKRDISVRKFWDYMKSFFVSEEKTLDEVAMNHVFLSASSDKQTSLEVKIEGKTRGIFTYTMCNELKKDKNLSLEELHKKVSEKLKADGFEQTPQLECIESVKGNLIFS